MSRKFAVIRGMMAGASLAALSFPTVTFAQDAQGADDAGLGEIIVTAQRREEKLQDVPVAVTAVTAEALGNKGIQNTLDLAQVVPALTFTSTAGSTQVRIRGVGTTNFGPGVENPVAIYVDGVYIASTSGAFFNLANIERVEALKGPQGTLFGRNATGGLVQVVTPDPGDEFKGLLRAGYGNYQTVSADAYISGPLGSGVAADLAVHYSGMGNGWGTNVNTGNDVNRINSDFVIRSKVKIEPSDSVKFVLSGDYSRLLGSTPVTLQNRAGNFGIFEAIFTNRADANPANDLPLINRGGFYDNTATVDPRAEITAWGAGLNATFDLGGVELKSITAYRRTRFEDRFDIERVPQDVLNFAGVPKWQQFSQELQINGDAGALKYTAGLFYFKSTDEYDPFLLNFGPALAGVLVAPGVTSAVLQFNNAQKTESVAAYAQASYEILPATNLTLGGRYTDESKAASGTRSFIANFGPVAVPFVPVGTPYLAAGIAPKVKYNNFSYRIALDHKFTPDILGYISYNTGFKGGGYNLTEPTNPAYLPERLNAIEAGLKMELLDRKLRLNLSAYHYDYSNIQVSNFITTAPFIVNAAKAKIDGFEAEFEARVTRGLTLSGGIAYADARFSNFLNADYTYIVPGCTPTGVAATPCKADASGNRLPATPRFSGNIGFNYEAGVGNGLIGVNGNLFHSGAWFGTFDNDPRQKQDSYEVVNASIYFEPSADGLRFTLWAKNLFGAQYAQNRYMSSQQSVFQAAAPRTWGVTVEKKF